MTYAEQYLKDGVSEYDFVEFVFNEATVKWNREDGCTYISNLDLLHLLQQKVEPDLTKYDILNDINID